MMDWIWIICVKMFLFWFNCAASLEPNMTAQIFAEMAKTWEREANQHRIQENYRRAVARRK